MIRSRIPKWTLRFTIVHPKSYTTTQAVHLDCPRKNELLAHKSHSHMRNFVSVEPAPDRLILDWEFTCSWASNSFRLSWFVHLIPQLETASTMLHSINKHTHDMIGVVFVHSCAFVTTWSPWPFFLSCAHWRLFYVELVSSPHVMSHTVSSSFCYTSLHYRASSHFVVVCVYACWSISRTCRTTLKMEPSCFRTVCRHQSGLRLHCA